MKGVIVILVRHLLRTRIVLDHLVLRCATIAARTASSVNRVPPAQRYEAGPASFIASHLRLQPDLDQATDGFWPGGSVWLFASPLIEWFREFFLKSHENRLTSRLRARLADFSDITSCFYHVLMISRNRARR